MIAGFCGSIGSGKTLSMVRQAYKMFLEGKTIYSNIHLNFPHTRYKVEDLQAWATDNKGITNLVLLIDEAHIYLDSRTSISKRNKIITYLLLQTRKISCDVYFTTQFFDQVDKRLRNLTDHIIECFTKERTSGMFTLNIVYTRKNQGYSKKEFVFYSNDIFKLYDTNEIVGVS